MTADVKFDHMLFAAFQAASRGAQEYLRVHNLTAEPEALKACLVSWVKIMLPDAMKDAKEALDCGMRDAAVATFGASMMQAGIEAAKEAGKSI